MHHCFTLFPSSSFSSLPTSHPDWSLTPEQVEVTTAIVDIDHSSTVAIRFVGSTHCKVYTAREGGDEKGGEEGRGEGQGERVRGEERMRGGREGRRFHLCSQHDTTHPQSRLCQYLQDPALPFPVWLWTLFLQLQYCQLTDSPAHREGGRGREGVWWQQTDLLHL